MLEIHRPPSSSPKIYFTHSLLPRYLDPRNLPTKKHPFTTIAAQPFTHTLDLLLPAELYALVSQKLAQFADARYAHVYMSLSDILAPDFLDTYIRTGNITMLSAGRLHVDNRFELVDGVLRLELDRATYERCGLVGSAIEDGGRKHQRQRWVVRVDLTAPAMRAGKKGFERVLWACRNVLDARVAWVFWNAMPGSAEALGEGRELLSRFAPRVEGFGGEVVEVEGVVAPRVARGRLAALYEEEEALDLLEWLHLLSLESPRVVYGDDIDPHLARYAVPDMGSGVAVRDFVRVRWRGFIVPAFVQDVFLAVRSGVFKTMGLKDGVQDVDMEGTAEAEKAEQWFALCAQGFGGSRGWTVMQFEDRQTLSWQTER